MTRFEDGSRTSATHGYNAATYIVQVYDTGGDQDEELLGEEVDREVPHELLPEKVSWPRWSHDMQVLTFQRI
jgi:hypothetical protein